MPQHSLFSSEENLPPWELDDLASKMVARIVLPEGFTGELDYLVPPKLEAVLEPAMRVMVPLGRGNRPLLGYCIGIDNLQVAQARNPRGLKFKSISAIVDEQRLISDSMLELARWIADHYLTPIGSVLEAMLPAAVRDNAGTRLTTVMTLVDDWQKRLGSLEKRKPKGTTNDAGNPINMTPKQLYVIDVLKQSTEPLTLQELQRAAKCSSAPIMTLKRLGFFNSKTIRRHQFDPEEPTKPTLEIDPHQLSSSQHQALTKIIDAVRAGRHETFLLHGVTGSGKTEVYIQAIHEVVRMRRQAIVLVPEISLTPQTVGRFKSRFPDVAVLHSHLPDAERHRQWLNIVEGKVQVVVGARSAVFAPLPRLGLIVIDEEHENTFKQNIAPRYHARDVAKKRAEMQSVPMVLGSATPSLESWYEANRQPDTPDEKRSCHLISMPHRVGGLRLPNVEIVDLREEVRQRTTRGAIHRQLHNAIKTSLDDGGQVILLLNRRGYSTHIQCPACGEIVKCPHCDISLTYHRTPGVEYALCHYCDYQIPPPSHCPKCRFSGIRYGGFATQTLEVEIKARFPNAAVLRMDTDTMQRRGSHERALSQFRDGHVQILLGTQMIAKGLDFPNVTLVGVINADTALYLPDFRASERTFHLITQVAGRTGRGKKGGRVIVQTFCPDHAAIQAAARHDYLGFVKGELSIRKLLGHPPFSQMARIVVQSEEEKQASNFANEFTNRIKQVGGKEIRFLGPAPAPNAKLKNFYRFHLLLYAPATEIIRKAIRAAVTDYKTPQVVQWTVDIDPVEML